MFINLKKNNLINIQEKNSIQDSQKKELNDFTVQIKYALKGHLQIFDNFAILSKKSHSELKIQSSIKKINNLVTRSLQLAQLSTPIQKDSRFNLNEVVAEVINYLYLLQSIVLIYL